MLEFLKEVYTLLNNNDLEMAKILVSEKIEEVAGVDLSQTEVVTDGIGKYAIINPYNGFSFDPRKINTVPLGGELEVSSNTIIPYETGCTQSICNCGQKAVDNNGTE